MLLCFVIFTTHINNIKSIKKYKESRSNKDVIDFVTLTKGEIRSNHIEIT